jgi:hypothetical protein
MLDWVKSVGAILDDPRPIAEAVAARHVRFEQIHPFLDGTIPRPSFNSETAHDI